MLPEFLKALPSGFASACSLNIVKKTFLFVVQKFYPPGTYYKKTDLTNKSTFIQGSKWSCDVMATCMQTSCIALAD
jgi:hypothetical protein